MEVTTSGRVVVVVGAVHLLQAVYWITCYMNAFLNDR